MTPYGMRWLIVSALTAALLLGCGARLPLAAAPPANQPQQARAALFTPHVPARALAYQRAERTIGLFSIAWYLAGLALLLRSGTSAKLRDAVYRLARRDVPLPDRAPPFRALLVYYLLFSVLSLAWRLPFLIARHSLEAAYGFSHQPPVNWCVDLLKLLVTGWIVIPLFWAIVTLIARYPRRWWVFATAIVAPVLLVTIVLEPVLLSPLFNSYRPLSAGPLRSTILGLAARAGIRSAEVLVEDTSRRTSHVNAYVTGLGPSARIILNDTAIRQLPEDQLLAMVGHEMGHYVEGHIWVGFWSGCIGIATLFWFGCRLLPAAARSFGASRGNIKGMTDIAAIPLLLLFLNLFLLVQDPVANGISRSLEHRADAFGMRLTHLNEATARLMIGFAERDYSDPDPPALYQFWFGTHPSLSERIRFALSQDRDPATREPTPPR